MLAGDGGYVHSEGDANWWIPSVVSFSRQMWSDTPAQELALRGNTSFSRIALAIRSKHSGCELQRYDLLVKQTIDPLGNRVVRITITVWLQPFRVTDPNGNRADVAFDSWG